MSREEKETGREKGELGNEGGEGGGREKKQKGSIAREKVRRKER